MKYTEFLSEENCEQECHEPKHINKAIAVVKKDHNRNVVMWKDVTRPQAKLNVNRYGH